MRRTQLVLQPDNGLLVHGNHFESPAALAKLKDTGLPTTPDSRIAHSGCGGIWDRSAARSAWTT